MIPKVLCKCLESVEDVNNAIEVGAAMIEKGMAKHAGNLCTIMTVYSLARVLGSAIAQADCEVDKDFMKDVVQQMSIGTLEMQRAMEEEEGRHVDN